VHAFYTYVSFLPSSKEAKEVIVQTYRGRIIVGLGKKLVSVAAICQRHARPYAFGCANLYAYARQRCLTDGQVGHVIHGHQPPDSVARYGMSKQTGNRRGA
jgi:hypothetical protein